MFVVAVVVVVVVVAVREHVLDRFQADYLLEISVSMVLKMWLFDFSLFSFLFPIGKQEGEKREIEKQHFQTHRHRDFRKIVGLKLF